MGADRLKYHPSDKSLTEHSEGLISKGEIGSDSDFPLKINVRRKHKYYVTSDVCDCLPGHTQTGQSFIEGDWIFWNGNAWTFLGNNLQSFTGPIGPTGPTGDAMLDGYIELSFTAALEASGWKDEGSGWYSITLVNTGAAGNGQQNHGLGATDKIRYFVYEDDSGLYKGRNGAINFDVSSTGEITITSKYKFAGKVSLISTI